LYGGKFCVPILVNLLDQETVRAPREIFDGLAENPDPKGAEAVGRKLGDFFNHTMAVAALRRMGPVAEETLMKSAPSNDANVSLSAVKLLGDVGTSKSLTLLAKASKSKNPAVVAAAKEATKSIRERMKKPAE
jgi:HEAT repeat protein